MQWTETADGTWPPAPTDVNALPLCHSEYERYGRQMILPGFGGLGAQLKLKHSRVLVVGAGGLGCPAVQYLALGGVGHITVVDHDVVERSNLARQVLHDESRLGVSKAESIRTAVEALNPHVTVEAVVAQFTSQNALALVSSHDIVLDCTDNPLTRYLINDAAVLCSKAVVSGAAQGLEGQLVVLHKQLSEGAGPSSSSSRGPCYRCLFPVAPRPQDVTDCSEGGVLGTITGLVGTLQANETIKLLLEPIHQTHASPSLLLASPMSDSGSAFRTIKIRSRRRDCRACGDGDVLAQKGLRRIASLEEEDYVTFCGLRAPQRQDDDGGGIQALNVKQLASLPKPPDLVVDVRTEEEFSIVQLPRGVKTINLPWPAIRRDPQGSLSIIKAALGDVAAADAEVPVVCRRGNDSRLAVAALTACDDSSQRLRFVDVTGGLTAWNKDVDARMPMY